mmetsp:Transcript_5067/g.5191  ORF Transcript_5067/g.5191 Transcript_5067/m.5191 type:complete len:500 (+) Transcript_5067:123-1622(+)
MKASSSAPSTKPTMKYYLFSLAFTSSVLLFFAVRSPEIISMSLSSPIQALCVAVSIVALITLFIAPPVIISAFIRRFGLILMVLYSLKTEMDSKIVNHTTVRDLTNAICIVTGANSGTGYAITQLLVERGATVIMGCRSIQKCNHASKQIQNAIANNNRNISSPGRMHIIQLDLGDLYSVKNFVSEFSIEYPRLDVLVNNAGVISQVGERTKQGLEAAFGVMHIGHFALTKWLMPFLLEPLVTPVATSTEEHSSPHPFQSGARVVNLASEAYMFGKFDISLMHAEGTGDLAGEMTDNCENFGPYDMFNCCPFQSCPVTNGYARAKLANVLHINELQLHLDSNAVQLIRNGYTAPRRVVTASLHPGSVSTNIHWSLDTFSKLMRTSAEAAHVILHAIQSDDFVPGAYIDAMMQSHDLQKYRKLHLPTHLEAFPDISKDSLPFIRAPGIDSFSLPVWDWEKKNLIGSMSKDSVEMVPNDVVAAQLWHVSEKFVANWEQAQN